MSQQHSGPAEQREPNTNVVNEHTTLLSRGNYSDENQHQHFGSIDTPKHEKRSRMQTFFIILNLTCITITSSAATGLLTVGLPEITRKLALPEHLLLW
jgi:hypothetical protein